MSFDLPGRTKGRVWIDGATHDVLRVDEQLMGQFDYMLPPSRLPWLRRIGFHLVALRVAIVGEPWTTWFDPDELAGELRAMGFTRLEELDGPALDQRFFGGREKRVGGASAGRVMTAWGYDSQVDSAPA